MLDLLDRCHWQVATHASTASVMEKKRGLNRILLLGWKPASVCCLDKGSRVGVVRVDVERASVVSYQGTEHRGAAGAESNARPLVVPCDVSSKHTGSGSCRPAERSGRQKPRPDGVPSHPTPWLRRRAAPRGGPRISWTTGVRGDATRRNFLPPPPPHHIHIRSRSFLGETLSPARTWRSVRRPTPPLRFALPHRSCGGRRPARASFSSSQLAPVCDRPGRFVVDGSDRCGRTRRRRCSAAGDCRAGSWWVPAPGRKLRCARLTTGQPALSSPRVYFLSGRAPRRTPESLFAVPRPPSAVVPRRRLATTCGWMGLSHSAPNIDTCSVQ